MQGETTLFVTLIKKREWRWLIYKVMCLCSTLNLTQQDFTIQTSNNFVCHSRCSRYNNGRLSTVTCRKYNLKIIIHWTVPTCTPLCNNNTTHLFHHSLIRRHHGKKWNTKNDQETAPKKLTQNVKQIKLNGSWLKQSSPSNNNKFEALSGEENVEGGGETKRNTSKAPPIFVAGVENIKPIKELLVTVAGDDFELKVLNGTKVKIQPKSTEKYSNNKSSSSETYWVSYVSAQGR